MGRHAFCSSNEFCYFWRNSDEQKQQFWRKVLGIVKVVKSPVREKRIVHNFKQLVRSILYPTNSSTSKRTKDHATPLNRLSTKHESLEVEQARVFCDDTFWVDRKIGSLSQRFFFVLRREESVEKDTKPKVERTPTLHTIWHAESFSVLYFLSLCLKCFPFEFDC